MTNVIYRDNKVVDTVYGDDASLMHWFHTNTLFSMDMALRFQGYSVRTFHDGKEVESIGDQYLRSYN